MNAYGKKYRSELKNKIISQYGGMCKCCGEKQILFLTIDHVNGRKTNNHGHDMAGCKLYNWLIKNNFPKDFQVLCMNCNWAKGLWKICPHQIEAYVQ